MIGLIEEQYAAILHIRAYVVNNWIFSEERDASWIPQIVSLFLL